MLIASYPIESSIQFVDVQNTISPLISKCSIKVCYVGQEPNRNGSVITKETAQKMAATLPGSPIIGRYNESTKDFTDHGIEFIEDEETGDWSLRHLTRPYGFIPTDARVWFEKFLDNGVEHEYLLTEGYLWTGVYPETSRVLVNGNNQSMEIDPKDWTEVCNPSSSFFIINDAVIRALCILGEDVEPCFEGAQIKQSFSLKETAEINKEFKQSLFSMMKTVEELLKGGNPVKKDEKQEEVFQEGAVVVNDNNSSQVVDTSNVDSNQAVSTIAVDITTSEEYQKLQEEFDKIQKANEEFAAQLNAMTEALENANASLKDLEAYKANIELQEKEAMIEKFSMLSDEEKKDVKDNIDNYSLDEIESKLSILAMRNIFSAQAQEAKPAEVSEVEEKEEVIPVVTFSLASSGETINLDTPEWVKALDARNK